MIIYAIGIMIIGAFGKFNPGKNHGLRKSEVFFHIPARDGAMAWTSEYQSVQNFLNYLARRSKSESSRQVSLDILRRFCDWVSMNPDELCQLPHSEVERLIQSYGDLSNHKGDSLNYTNTLMKKMRTFFEKNGHRKIELQLLFVPTRYRARLEYITTKPDNYKMVDAAGNPRDRAIIFCLFSSGLRMSTFRALNYGDIKEDLESGSPCVRIVVEPYLKERVHGACKGRIPYYTFFCKEAVDALKVYLRERLEIYGPHRDDDPLFSSRWRLYDKRDRPKTRLSHVHINRILKDAARLAGIKGWSTISAQIMRKSFESVLRSNTVDGGRLDKGTQEFFMGHILPGSQDYYYDRNDVDYHRNEYMKLDFGRPRETRMSDVLMTTLRMATDIDENPEVIVRQFIQTCYNGTLSWEQLSDDRRIGIMNDAIEWWRSKHNVERTPEQVDQVIDRRDLESYLQRGFIWVTTLDDEKLIVRKSGG